MSQCHKCEHNQDIISGKYADVPFEQTPCASCDKLARDAKFKSCLSCKHFDGIRRNLEYDPGALGCSKWTARKSWLSNKGKVHVSFNALQEGAIEGMEMPQEDLTQVDRYFDEPDKAVEAIDMAVDILRELFHFESKTRDIICFRLIKPIAPLKEIGDALGITVQATHSRLRRARKNWPQLAKIIKMAKYKTQKQ